MNDYTDLRWTDLESGFFPEEMHRRRQWMGRQPGKKTPFAPWGDADAPVDCRHSTCLEHSHRDDPHPDCDACQMHADGCTRADCGHDARYSWSVADHYLTGDDIEMALDDPQIGGRIFIHRDPEESDGRNLMLFDGDDVRDPETGEVHPAFIDIMDRIGLSWTEVSTSGAGVHVVAFGEDIPGDRRQAIFALDDEPWGSNDEKPKLEVYARKHVNVTTGKRVGGSPKEIREADLDALADVLDEYDVSESPGYDSEGVKEWERVTSSDEYEDATFENIWGESLEKVRDEVPDLDKMLSRIAPSNLDRNDSGWTNSEYDMSASSILYKWGFEPRDIERILWRYRNRSGDSELHPGKVEATVQKAQQVDRIDPPEERDDGSSGGAWMEGEWEPGWMVQTPTTDRAEAIATGWNWYADSDPPLSIEDVYERVEEEADKAMEYNNNILLKSPMASGKTYSAFKVAAERDEQVSYITTRTDLYDQAAEICEEQGMSYYILPSVHRHCPTFCGEHGEHLAEQVRDARARGATPAEIHEHMDLPCGGTDDEEGKMCPYHARWHFDEDEYDALIGHYSHAHLNQVVAGRHVIVDEYPGDSMRDTIESPFLERSINAFCEREPEFPAEGYVELIENRNDPEFSAEALEFLNGFDWDDIDTTPVFETEDYYKKTPHAIYTIVAGEPPGDANPGYGKDYTRLPGEGRPVGMFNHGDSWNESAVSIQKPPRDFNYSKAVIAMDGTPYKPMWEDALGIKLRTKEPIDYDEEVASFIHETLGVDAIQTSEHVKPYSSGEYVNLQKDRAVANSIAEAVSEPVVISAKKATEQYEDDGWTDDDGPAKELDHFANLRGSNRYADEQCAMIAGSPQYGHDWVKREAAFQNKAVYPEGKGNDLDYGDGEEIAQQMREAVILQTLMRFGRDATNGAVVYLHTSVVPDQIEPSATGASVKCFTDTQKDIFNVCMDLAERGVDITAPTVHEHVSLDCHRRTVQRTLNLFYEQGMFEAKDECGRRVVFSEWDAEPHYVTEDGIVQLPAADEVDTIVGGDGDRDSGHNTVFTPTFGVDPEEPAPLGLPDEITPGGRHEMGADPPPDTSGAD